ncbi:MAG: stress response translation initiation inhibitor YciH [Candidatus Lokiarchaeota archaeon]|nr:stress response translation initiation inhibitor YciH [Candidatus Lokiarchaeota archaeon]
MLNICPKCGLPMDLCVCESLNQEDQRITISQESRKWGRVVTVVTFNSEVENLKKLLKKAKTYCASGGTTRENAIEIQGDHRIKLKKFLIKQGFPEENIEIARRR